MSHLPSRFALDIIARHVRSETDVAFGTSERAARDRLTTPPVRAVGEQAGALAAEAHALSQHAADHGGDVGRAVGAGGVGHALTVGAEVKSCARHSAAREAVNG